MLGELSDHVSGGLTKPARITPLRASRDRMVMARHLELACEDAQALGDRGWVPGGSIAGGIIRSEVSTNPLGNGVAKSA